jgi:hypothetical protein
MAVLVIMGLPQFAHADVINLVSQSYEIHEHAGSVGSCCPQTFVIDQTSATPISRTDNGAFYDDMGHAVGGYHMFTSANGGVPPLNAFVESQTDEYDFGDALVGTNTASATLTFRPLFTDAVVQIANPWGGGPERFIGGPAGLYDETTGAAILVFGSGLDTPALYSVSLNVDHLYTISAASEIGPERGITLSIAPASVPESESTLTFLVVGLGALLIIARSQMFCPSS